jgi:glycosyltransferase involved in cell wall biosynthesis
VRPGDGGQLRAAAEHRELRSAGARVTSLAITTDSRLPEDYGRHDIRVPAHELDRAGYHWVTHDIALGRHVLERPELLAQVRRTVASARPDVVVLDQPWLWPVVRTVCPGLPVVYSAQNIEWRLKATNLRIAGLAEAVVERWSRETEALERDVATQSILTAAVSDADADWLRANGAARTVVVPNGTTRRTAEPARATSWRRHFAGRGIALFVASGHPPNAVGFWDMLGPSLGFLTPVQRIVAVGSVGPQIRAHEAFVEHRAANNGRLVIAGFQSDADLAALLDIAGAVLLPITSGEGSNLKTAEALVSGRPIIATTHAFRGFESYLDQPGVSIADDAARFRSLVASSVGPTQAPGFVRHVDALTWPRTLQPLVTEVLRIGSRL